MATPGPSPLVLAVLVAGVVTAAGALWLDRPPVSRPTVLALAPWMVAGASVHAIAGFDGYPAVLAELFGPWTAYATTFVVVSFVAVLFHQLAVVRGSPGHLPYYLGSMGVGVAAVPVAFFVFWGVRTGNPNLIGIVIWPTVAAIVTGAAVFLLALWYTDALAYTGVAGVLVVYGQTLDGMVTAAAVQATGPLAHTEISRAVVGAVVGLPTASYVAPVWHYALAKLLLGLVLIALLAGFARENERPTNVVLAALAALGIGPGFYGLLQFAVL